MKRQAKRKSGKICEMCAQVKEKWQQFCIIFFLRISLYFLSNVLCAFCFALLVRRRFFDAVLDEGEGRLNNLVTFFFAPVAGFFCGSPKVCSLSQVNSEVSQKKNNLSNGHA